MTEHAHGGVPIDAVLVLVAVVAVAGYLGGVRSSRARGRPWPRHRAVLWVVGIAAACASVAGPLAHAAHDDFVAHMATHLLAGMLAPLLLVLAAPVTLALRTLDVVPARRLSRLLGSFPARLVAHPVTAAVLSAGGLWVIYSTPLFSWMQASPLVHLTVHAHLLAAGFLFTAAFVGVDPRPHRMPRAWLAAILVLSTASHSILAKHLYGHPPTGVPDAAAQAGAEFMYYGGGAVEAAIMVLFCARWYRAAGRRMAAAPA